MESLTNHTTTMPPRNNRKERSSPERQTQPPKSQTQPPPSSRKHGGDIPSSSSAADNFSSQKRIVFPPGFKFVPTDEDLIFHYLKPFLQGNKNSYPNVPIHRVNIYESNPEQLSSLSFFLSSLFYVHQNWFLFGFLFLYVNGSVLGSVLFDSKQRNTRRVMIKNGSL